ncbi:hypothetical protein CSUI_001187, partial [Cystoisospora suis]
PIARVLSLDTPLQSDTLSLRHAVIFKQCRDNMIKAQMYQKKYADKKRRHVEFKAGQQVWLNSQHLTVDGFSSVFKDRYLGPFRILAMIGESAARLDLPPT